MPFTTPFTVQELQSGFRVGDCLVEPRQNRIIRCGVEVRIEPRVMDVLVCLASQAGEVVSRETLNAQVWREVVVTDQAVTNCISELRHHLGHDAHSNRVIETIPKRGYRLAAAVQLAQAAQAAAPALAANSNVAPARPLRRWKWLALAGVIAVLSGLTLWWWRAADSPQLISVAVARFENPSGDATLNYLSLALPDEIATLLTKSRDLAVRPFAFVEGEDPLATARERGVDHVVTGRYYREDDDTLSLAIEAQQVAQQRVVWRTRITAPAGDLLALRASITDSLRQGLLPALGVAAGPSTASMPANSGAYQLYLRSLALPQQPEQTRQAIGMLEEALTLEPTFAPAWEALGRRYYDSGTWFTGLDETRRKSLAAHRRALELDPDNISAARQIVTYRVEAGDLAGAYEDARRLLQRFGPGADTHFSLSYVYRYGGMLEHAQRHCELALDRDPQDPRLRSCAYPYLYAGKLSRVPDFLALDAGAYFVQWGTVLYHLRRDDREAALHVVRQTAVEPTRRLMEPCLEGARGPALTQAAADFVRHWEQSDDPEAAYALAPMLSYCGRPQDALKFLARAGDMGFCAFPALDQDPIWAGLRGDPEFQRIRAAAVACHERFRQQVEAHDRTREAT